VRRLPLLVLLEARAEPDFPFPDTGLPILISFILLAAFGARQLDAAPSFASGVPATAANVLSFISIVVGFTSASSSLYAIFLSLLQN